MPLAGRSSKSQRRLARFETCQSTRTLLALCATGETSRTETELRGPMPMTRRGGCSPARTGHQFDQDTYTKTFTRHPATLGYHTSRRTTLRHLAGTKLLEAGVPARVVADVLGHSSTRVTNDTYLHVRESIAAQAVGRIADQLVRNRRT